MLNQRMCREIYPDEGRLSFMSNKRESFNPNRHSGVPVRYARIMICPETSARNAVPIYPDQRLLHREKISRGAERGVGNLLLTLRG